MILEESQLYRDLMRLKPDGWTANAWAVRAGVSRTVWTDMRRHGNPSRRTLEKLLTVAGSSLAEFEALRIGEPNAPSGQPAAAVSDRTGAPWRSGALPTLPVVAASIGGTMDAQGMRIHYTQLSASTILDRLPRPHSLAGDPGAYAFTVVTDTMWPRFRPGRPVAVSPTAPVEPGDDVLAILSSDVKGRTSALIAELVSCSTDQIELRQFNPDATFSLPSRRLQGLQKIIGNLI